MSRATTIILAALAAAVLGVFVWFWLIDESSLSEIGVGETGRSDSAGEEALTEENLSPVQTPQEAPQPSETAAGSSDEADTGPYKFERWEDAADHMAELMGLEYDARLAAGIDSKNARIQAYNVVRKRIFDDEEDPALLAALMPYLPYDESVPMEKRTRPAMPLEEYGSTEFLVRAGRLPPSALKQGHLTLPNGNRYYFDPNEEVIVKWQKRYVPAETEGGKIELAMWEGILAKANAELAQNPGDTETQEDILAIQAEMDALTTPQLKNYHRSFRIREPDEARRRSRMHAYEIMELEKLEVENPQPTRPEYKLTILELGVIE